MKKFIVLLLACVLIAGSAGGAFAVVYGSAGYISEGYDESSAWEIDSVKTLIKMRDDINNGIIDSTGKFYKLTADLDLTSYAEWTPIGVRAHDFVGNFDGNGHNIKIAIKRATQSYIGLFGSVYGGQIKNLSVSGSINYVLGSFEVYAGGISAVTSGRIENCEFNGKITISGNKQGHKVYVGGITGDMFLFPSCHINNCKFDGEITILNCSASEDNCAGGIAGRLAGWDFPAEITNCSVGSKNRSTVIKSLYVSNSNNKTYAGGIVGLIYDNTCSVVVTVVKNNYSRLKTAARYTDTLTYGNISQGSHYYYWPGVQADISNNIEVNPDGEPTYETTKWEIANGNLTVKHTGISEDITFSPIDGTNGTGFKISGDFPEGLMIHLPANWEFDVDDGEKVTASDTSKVKEAKDVDGLESPAVKIIGSNDITLNESGIIMTAWYTGTPPSVTIYDLSILAGTWQASNEIAIATSGDISETMTLSAKHTNKISFKNIHVSGDTATLESVSDIYMDIAGFPGEEWEEDFGGYKPYESGVLEFKNIGTNIWRLDRTRHNNKPTYTIITITSPTTAKIERYDEYDVKFNVSYTIIKDVPLPQPAKQYETSEWNIHGVKLSVTYTDGHEAITVPCLPIKDGARVFRINGTLPENLTIHLPANWELDIYYGARVTVSDTSKVKEAKDVDGLGSPVMKIIGSNDITLNEPRIVMTAWYTGTNTSETTSWTKQGSKLIIETNGTPSRYEFDALTSPDTNGDGFKITGLPAGLKINLPDKWGIDIDKSYSVIVSETFGIISKTLGKIIHHTDIPGMPSTAYRIMGSNDITLNASGIEMTAFLFTAPKIITPENLGTFSANEDISIQLQAEGTQWTMEWTHEGLPEGLSLSNTGLISGKISQEGTYKFKILVSNCAGTYIERFTMTVRNAAAAPVITMSEDLGTFTVGDYVSITLQAEGTSPITWSITGGQLPPGLGGTNVNVLSARTAIADKGQRYIYPSISGTLTKAGTYSFTVTAANSAGSDSKTFTMTVNEYPSSIKAPSITTASLPDAKAGAIYTFSFDAAGTAPIEWTSDNLPEGFTLGTSGNLAGLPKTAGVYSFTVTAANSAGSDSREFTLTVNAPRKTEVPKIITKSITEAAEGQPYTFKLEAEGINLTWSSLNALPKDLTLSKEGIISGTPQKAGTYRVIFVVKNSAGTDNAVLTLKVKTSSSSSLQKPKVKTTKLPDGFKDMEYSYQLEAEGTVDEWKLADGSTLPSGLELDTETGEISGVIAESSAKTFKFKVIAVNEAGESAAKNISIKITAQTPYFKTEDLKAATWNKSYSFTVKVANFKAVTWTIEGDMPEGLKFDKGKFSGKPKEAGEFDLTIKANNGSTEIEQDFILRVNSIPPKLTGSFKTGTEGKYYECKLKATGSTPIEWDFSYLPEGLTPTIDATGETCIISGTPTEVFAQTIEIILTNGDNEGDSITAHKKMTIKAVKPKFATTAKDIPNGTVNESYSYQLQLKEGFIPASVTWEYTGDMPEGLELDQNGIIYGVPSEAVKKSRFTVFARNAAKESYFAKLAITMTINESEENTNLPAVKEDDAEDSKPEFVDGVAYYERGEISAEDSARLAGSNEIIAAYLPAVEVETENVYEFTVSLDVSAPEGGLLVWHSFPDGKYDDSESEAYFLDGEDSVIEYVPENHTVTVQAWLKPGIIYEPVIAVKIQHKD